MIIHLCGDTLACPLLCCPLCCRGPSCNKKKCSHSSRLHVLLFSMIAKFILGQTFMGSKTSVVSNIWTGHKVTVFENISHFPIFVWVQSESMSWCVTIICYHCVFALYFCYFWLVISCLFFICPCSPCVSLTVHSLNETCWTYRTTDVHIAFS